MIRHLYTAKLKPGVRPEPIAAWREALLGLRIEGMQALLAGPDLELRAGNDSFAIVADFDDAEAWVRYDEDAEHNRIRRELAQPIVLVGHRVQFEPPEERPSGSIRNVTLIGARPEAARASIAELAAALRALTVEGMDWIDVEPDLGLREGNADLAVVADFNSIEAYHRYDQDEEHNRIRRELAGPITAWISRVQFRIQD